MLLDFCAFAQLILELLQLLLLQLLCDLGLDVLELGHFGLTLVIDRLDRAYAGEA